MTNSSKQETLDNSADVLAEILSSKDLTPAQAKGVQGFKLANSMIRDENTDAETAEALREFMTAHVADLVLAGIVSDRKAVFAALKPFAKLMDAAETAIAE